MAASQAIAVGRRFDGRDQYMTEPALKAQAKSAPAARPLAARRK